MIAWTAHPLVSLYTDYTETGEKFFESVIAITDRAVLDSQLQETTCRRPDPLQPR